MAAKQSEMPHNAASRQFQSGVCKNQGRHFLGEIAPRFSEENHNDVWDLHTLV